MSKPQTPEEILKDEHLGYSNEQMEMPGNRKERNFWHKEDIIPAMKEHARQAIKYALESNQQRFSKDVAEKLLLIRDALVAKDDDEAYHQLVLIVDPDLGYDHWSEVENMAKSSILSRYESILKELGL